MKGRDPLGPISHLIGENGFPSKDALGSFCLAVGLFHGRKKGRNIAPPRSWDPRKYDIWPMIELMAYRMEPGNDDLSHIRELLFTHLLGGVEMVDKAVGKKRGIPALKELSRFIPP